MSGLTDDEKLQLANMLEAHTAAILSTSDSVQRLAIVVGKMQDEAHKQNEVLVGLLREVEAVRRKVS